MSQRCRPVILCTARTNPLGGPKCLISQHRSPSLSGSGSCKFDGETAKTPLKPDPDPWSPKSLRDEVMRPALLVCRWEKVAGQPRVRSLRTAMVFQSEAEEKKKKKKASGAPSNPDDEGDGIFRLPNKEGAKEGELWQDSDMGNWSQPRHNMLI